MRVGLTFSRRGENLGSLFRPFLSWSTTAAILWRWIAWIWRVEAEINVVSHCDHDFSLLSRAFSSFLNALSFVAFIFSFFFSSTPLFSSTFFYRSFPLRGVILYYGGERSSNEGKGLIVTYCSLFYGIGWRNVCSNLLVLKCYYMLFSLSLSFSRQKVCYLFLRYIVINFFVRFPISNYRISSFGGNLNL